jgi:nudix-type nucleoside diphosphatase (YffH/AdpP family)
MNRTFTTMKVEIIDEQVILDEFFEVHKGKLKFERFNGDMSEEVTRYSFTKSDAVAVLLYHTEDNAYILVRQMRYPPVLQQVDPWLIEIVAGGMSTGEDETEAAMREVEEETGYKPKYIERLMQFYVSPGIMSERITLFYAEVDDTCKINHGGGAAHEDEDTEIVKIPRQDAMMWIESQEVGDAKTILALQWHALRTV